MSNGYKKVGTLGNIVRVRTDVVWIITFPDGEEAKFESKKHAIMGAKAALSQGMDIKLEEETLMRFNKDGQADDEKFRIDMTETIKLMMSIESKLEVL